ncbi:hypothetical protein HYW82_03840 [Candidatus Peregrinibacteria bacterium]|nr:hypothetical protein [Candidatus Peregrinibacteria bacterium]
MTIENLSDKDLYFLCKKYGDQALDWRRKFIGLLPEVNKRRLFEKHGFTSIFEFAAKIAGVSKEQVCRALNLEKKFDDKPVLHSMLVEGKISINKLARIASIATVENEKSLAKSAKVLPYRALETLVRDEKIISESVRAHMSGRQKKTFGATTKRHRPQSITC